VFGLTTLNTSVDGLDNRISGKLQVDLYAGIQEVLLDRIVWFLRHGGLGSGLTKAVKRFGEAVSAVDAALDRVLPDHEVAAFSLRCSELARRGVPADLARRLVALPLLADATDAQLVAEDTRQPIEDAARAYFAVADAFRLSDIAARAQALPVSGYYDRLALDRAVSDLAAANRRIAAAALKSGGIRAWTGRNEAAAARTRQALGDIASGADLTVSKLAVAAGLLGDLAGA
jgi:glutamate dehydrogenase